MIVSENTLRQVKQADQYWLRQCTDTFISWYFRNCGEITAISEYFGEDDVDAMLDILNNGLRSIQDRIEMMKEGDMKRGDQL